MLNIAGQGIRNVGSQYACFLRHVLVRSPSNCRTLVLRPVPKTSPLVSQSAATCTYHKVTPRSDPSISHCSLTVTLMSRITLDLLSFANTPNNAIIYDYDNTARQPHILPPHPHQTFLPTVSQTVMSFAPPSPTASPPPPPPPQTPPSICPPQHKVRRLPPTPRNDARATAASSLSSLESGSGWTPFRQ
jgi:hypothetical protein